MRKLLHDHAEYSGKEHGTRKMLLDVLKNHKGKIIECQDGCSFFVLYDFQKERTVMIRSEMDGLEVAENDIRHVCGHDGHMAILCALSHSLSMQLSFPVNVLLVFQSSEETGAGALNVLNDPKFLRLCPDEAIALHVYPGLKTGFYTKEGVLCAAGREVDVSFCGASGHCALRLKNTAMMQACALVNELSQMDFEDGLISFNVIYSGQARNQISAEAHIQGTMRSLSVRTEKRMMNWLMKSQGQCTFSSGYPLLMNHSRMVMRALNCGAHLINEPLWICDDFAYVAQCIPSVYVLMAMESEVPLHHRDFEFDDALIETGVDFLMKMLKKTKKVNTK